MGAGIIWKLLYLYVWYVGQDYAKAGLSWSCWQDHVHVTLHVDVILLVRWLGSGWEHPKRRESSRIAWWNCMAFGDLASETTDCSFCPVSPIKAMTGLPLFKGRCCRSRPLMGVTSTICDCFLNDHNIQFTMSRKSFFPQRLFFTKYFKEKHETPGILLKENQGESCVWLERAEILSMNSFASSSITQFISLHTVGSKKWKGEINYENLTWIMFLLPGYLQSIRLLYECSLWYSHH